MNLFKKTNVTATLIVAFSILWFSAVAWYADKTLKPLYEVQSIDVSIPGGYKSRIIFSGSQSKEDIDLIMKEEYVPAMEKSPNYYSGKVISIPFEKYAKENSDGIIQKYLLVAFIPVFSLILCIAVYLRRTEKMTAESSS